ncbi:XRE family transcriptional regulator [Clostridium botulinum]|uniref:XRE family transcriptional regulator n=1 Tax=Clostridium botulinum TaxID=1491 RepID=A0A6M0SUF3_CLOBO|nr:XRE family transcriptional regulator [Clostridium botulinum]NFG22667.1 helix-turn-helix transcriptional regulator [Clostridium botulinum]NFR13725.1 helix-turn-helix transcriptional regulator [Clostridium botulinum]NFR42208.1 helix-turn-helix transcriptional regulator [Clostridium botulinum]NFS50648.1 helix-turn-helix transcriptional regulator [Clostridium botulinum]
MNIGDNIKRIRTNKKISQKDFAIAIDMPISTLANYENNHREPNIETLTKIANALGIPASELITEENLVQVKKTINNEIVVFSHVNGRVETIACEEYEIISIGNTAYVKAINYGEVRHIIPFNRVKQINLDI